MTRALLSDDGSTQIRYDRPGARPGPARAPLGRRAAAAAAAVVVLAAAAALALALTAAHGPKAAPRAAGQARAGAAAAAALPGSTVTGGTVTATAVAGGEQIAVGSADGYPAVWRMTGGAWTLATSPLTSAGEVGGATARPGTLTSVTHGSSGWLAVGMPGPVILTSANGITWRAASGSITRNLAGVAAVAAAAGPHGYVIAGKLIAAGGACVADVWWSDNLTSWTRAHDVNDTTGSSQVLAAAAGASGFVTSGSHDGRPAVWITAGGKSWTTRVLPMPADASGADLQQVTISGNRVVALGQQTTPAGVLPLAELSTDGGMTWQQVPAGTLTRPSR